MAYEYALSHNEYELQTVKNVRKFHVLQSACLLLCRSYVCTM